MPSYVKGVAGSVAAIFEGIKNATGLDVAEILGSRKRVG